jgi:hypothetical protein
VYRKSRGRNLPGCFLLLKIGQCGDFYFRGKDSGKDKREKAVHRKVPVPTGKVFNPDMMDGCHEPCAGFFSTGFVC